MMQNKQLKAHALGIMEKYRAGIAILVVLPLIGGLFWLMYYWAVENSQPKKTSLEQPKQQERVVAVEAPTEMKTKTQPDITVVLGLKKPVPKKREEPLTLVQGDEAEGARKGKVGRQEAKPEPPDPYPDAK